MSSISDQNTLETLKSTETAPWGWPHAIFLTPVSMLLECGLRNLEVRTEEIRNRSQEIGYDLASRNKSRFVLSLVKELKASV